ncbi:MAG: transglycosylase SLT domain-containing protein [Gemmatimonadales bacterium]
MNDLSATQQLTLRGVGILAVVLAVGFAVGLQAPRAVAWDEAGGAYTGTAARSQFNSLQQSLNSTAGELELLRLKLGRAESILEYSARYQITSDLADLIYGTALREGIDPDLAFRMVNVESDFTRGATSAAGALGLVQVQLATAKFYDANITTEELYDPATNLAIGFRYIRDLIEVYGDVKLALLAYNRGPSRIKKLLDEGHDPQNGYASLIMEGYSGSH